MDSKFFEKEEPKEGETKKEVSTIFSAKQFEELDINPRLKKSLERLKLKRMTRVQQQGIPEILKKGNVAIKSETGSGKTLTYLIPIMA